MLSGQGERAELCFLREGPLLPDWRQLPGRPWEEPSRPAPQGAWSSQAGGGCRGVNSMSPGGVCTTQGGDRGTHGQCVESPVGSELPLDGI